MNLSKLRAKKAITQAQLAASIGVDETTVSKWESGAAMPRAATLKKLSAIFGCTIDELLKDSGE